MPRRLCNQNCDTNRMRSRYALEAGRQAGSSRRKIIKLGACAMCKERIYRCNCSAFCVADTFDNPPSTTHLRQPTFDNPPSITHLRHYMHTTCTLYAHYMHTICRLYAHYMHIICTLHAHYMHTICRLYALYMHTICTLYAHYMHTICTLYAHYMHTICKLIHKRIFFT